MVIATVQPPYSVTATRIGNPQLIRNGETNSYYGTVNLYVSDSSMPVGTRTYQLTEEEWAAYGDDDVYLYDLVATKIGVVPLNGEWVNIDLDYVAPVVIEEVPVVEEVPIVEEVPVEEPPIEGEE